MDEFDAECPWCGEPITLVIDLSQESAAYVEDCEVCCRPLVVRYAAEDGELVELAVDREGE
jgi:hypothetical protein